MPVAMGALVKQQDAGINTERDSEVPCMQTNRGRRWWDASIGMHSMLNNALLLLSAAMFELCSKVWHTHNLEFSASCMGNKLDHAGKQGRIRQLQTLVHNQLMGKQEMERACGVRNWHYCKAMKSCDFWPLPSALPEISPTECLPLMGGEVPCTKLQRCLTHQQLSQSAQDDIVSRSMSKNSLTLVVVTWYWPLGEGAALVTNMLLGRFS
ncbi:hypothetical protein BDR06DRAFT_966761 [Suillus hirtellus]|nr:hypothetical protein BDR06DRAFT_966761 [Suillus hirtellus]